MDRGDVSYLRPRTNRRPTCRRSWAKESRPEDLPVKKTTDKGKIRTVVEKLASVLFNCNTLSLEEPGKTARPCEMVTRETGRTESCALEISGDSDAYIGFENSLRSRI